jgi:hypothetical protein
MCYAFVGLDNKRYKMHGTYIKVKGTRCTVRTSNTYLLFNVPGVAVGTEVKLYDG